MLHPESAACEGEAPPRVRVGGESFDLVNGYVQVSIPGRRRLFHLRKKQSLAELQEEVDKWAGGSTDVSQPPTLCLSAQMG